MVAAYAYVVTTRENNHRQLLEKGEAALAGANIRAAIEAFSGAIFMKPDSMIGYLKRGEAYRRSGELEEAQRDLGRAIALDPTAPRPRELLGDVNYAQQRYAPAADQYQHYVSLDDRSPRVLYKLALARYRAGQPALGIDALKTAVAIDPRFSEAYYLLGLCLRDAQKVEDARAALERAIALAPAPATLQAREELADLYGRLGRLEKWLEQLDVLRALDPKPARDVALGLAYARVGQSDRAVMLLRHAAERHPDHRYTYVALGRVWLELAQARADRVDLAKALEALEQAVGDEGSSEALTLFGRALLLDSKDELAERTLQQATENLPADPLAFYYLAYAAERRGHIETARQALLDYVALEGEDPDARRRAALAARIGDLSLRLNDASMAVAWYGRATGYASDASFLVRFAEARWRAGDPDVARAMLDKLLEKDPANEAARALRRRIR
jgi:tetratricopeptide (TPR) repeat protein